MQHLFFTWLIFLPNAFYFLFQLSLFPCESIHAEEANECLVVYLLDHLFMAVQMYVILFQFCSELKAFSQSVTFVIVTIWFEVSEVTSDPCVTVYQGAAVDLQCRTPPWYNWNQGLGDSNNTSNAREEISCSSSALESDCQCKTPAPPTLPSNLWSQCGKLLARVCVFWYRGIFVFTHWAEVRFYFWCVAKTAIWVLWIC